MIPFLAPLAGFLSPVGNLLKRIPDWLIIAVIFVITLKVVDMAAEHRGRQRQKERTAKDSAEAEAKIITTITENSNDLVRESDRVRAHDSAVILPDGTAGLKPYDYRD